VQVPAPFDYERATSVEDALARLARLGPDARFIAGGHSLLPMMKLRVASPEALVDINDLSELDYIREQDGEMRIGALTRHRELKENADLAARFPVFAEAEAHIADPVVRNRGTIGGSLCQGDPAEDLSAVCTALKASVVIRGSAGERVVAMSDFHRGPYETAVGDGELLTEVRIPIRPRGGSAYAKVDRRAGDWAVVAAGAAVWLDGAGLIADARVGLAAVGPNTAGIPEVSAALRGHPPTDEVFAEAGRLAAAGCHPVTDVRGTEAYKRHLADELTRRTLRAAAERAAARA
jgi:carbon-monoxide dehydrogenase medium subunit